MDWELISEAWNVRSQYRAKVFGGWLVRIVENHHYNAAQGSGTISGENITVSMTFVPDIHHEWKIEGN